MVNGIVGVESPLQDRVYILYYSFDPWKVNFG